MPSLDHPTTSSFSRTESTLVSAIRSPKRSRGADYSRAKWFRYYAGYSAGFVEDTLNQLDLDPNAILLDPWLGAGTTAEVAATRGYQVRGYDLNPAMLLVARARTLATDSKADIAGLVKRIAVAYERASSRVAKTGRSEIDDSLEKWLQPASARAFRLLEGSVAATVLGQPASYGSAIWSQFGRVSSTAAFFYVGLFRTLRHFIADFQSSNPTWVKVSDGKQRVQLSIERIGNRFFKEIALLQDALNSEQRVMPSVGNRKCAINLASSTKLPLSVNSVDVVLSSPPYCTRIDYVHATLPELAVIRFPNGDVLRRLREGMIGTPTIARESFSHDRAWGSTCNRFLSDVEAHTSKASSTYYLKYYRQYFVSAFASMREIDRVLKKAGHCVLVVQDSYYKEVLNDLPTIFCEMALGIGWKLKRKIDFPVKRTLAGINPRAKQYRDAFQAVESALIFQK